MYRIFEGGRRGFRQTLCILTLLALGFGFSARAQNNDAGEIRGTVTTSDGAIVVGAQITITNHPIGGPVFAGPQIQPWTCEAGATDAQCNLPTAYAYQ